MEEALGNPSYFYESIGNVQIMLWIHMIYAVTFIQLQKMAISSFDVFFSLPFRQTGKNRLRLEKEAK